MNALRITYLLTMGSYFALLSLLLLWHTWLVPPYHVPIAFILIIMVLPLLIPLRGLLHGKLYTYTWTHFLALLYFMHGIGAIAADPAAKILGIGEVIFSISLYTATLVHIRAHRNQQQASATNPS